MLHQQPQHARQALLGDAQQSEQVCHGDTGIAADEVQRAMMGTAEADLVENAIGTGGKVAIGKEQQILCAADLFLAQKQQIGAGTRALLR